MFKFSTRALSIVEIWQQGFEFYKAVIMKIWPLVLVMMLLSLSGNVILPQQSLVVGNSNFSSLATNPSHHLAIGGAIYAIVTSLLSLFVLAMILHRMSTIIKQPGIDVSASAQAVLNRYIYIVPAILILYVLMAVGTIMVVVPGVFIAFLLCLTLPLVLFDKLGPIAALKQSAKLVWGRWWQIFGTLIVPLVVIAVVQHYLMTLLMPFNRWLYLVLAVAIMTFMHPFLHAVYLLTYRDCKLRQGFGEEEPQPVKTASEAAAAVGAKILTEEEVVGVSSDTTTPEPTANNTVEQTEPKRVKSFSKVILPKTEEEATAADGAVAATEIKAEISPVEETVQVKDETKPVPEQETTAPIDKVEPVSVEAPTKPDEVAGSTSAAIESKSEPESEAASGLAIEINIPSAKEVAAAQDKDKQFVCKTSVKTGETTCDLPDGFEVDGGKRDPGQPRKFVIPPRKNGKPKAEVTKNDKPIIGEDSKEA